MPRLVARIYGEINGYGSTADAYRVTDQHPDGRGAIGCMSLAIKDSGIDPPESTTSTLTVRVLRSTIKSKRWLVRQFSVKNVPPISSTKSMMGHLITAAGATELILCLMAINENTLPPTINYENPDPNCDLDYVPNESREQPCDVILNNSFGFGGQNVSIVASRFTD